MHNNGSIDITRPQKKEFYSVVEAAVQWARSEGAKNANDPRIGQYTDLILTGLKTGALKREASSAEPGLSPSPSLSSTIAFAELKTWFAEYHPALRPAFLFGKTK